jgi:pilus assembly protein Flp/PilA
MPNPSALSLEGKSMKQRLLDHAAILREDRGATAVEYGLIVALIAAVIVATVALLGTEINNAFTTVLNSF